MPNPIRKFFNKISCPQGCHRYYLAAALFVSVVLASAMAWATRFINFWPTDSSIFYLPVARDLFNFPYFSWMHNYLKYKLGYVHVLHGKEALVLLIAIMQRLLGDSETIFPNILVLILAVQISGLAVYFIARRLWGEHLGFLTFAIMASCFWPYMYVLLGAHQPMVMMFFLLSVFFIMYAQRRNSFYLLAGVSLGLMLFSSPTALAYSPYYIFFALLAGWPSAKFQRPGPEKFKHLACVFLGFLGVLMLFLPPDPNEAIGGLFKYIGFNRFHNHFDVIKIDWASRLGQEAVLPQPGKFRALGLIWVGKFAFLIMPVLFFLYITSLGYLLARSWRNKKILLILILSLATPLGVEIARVSQFGRNYFSWLIGVVFLTVYAAHDFMRTHSVFFRRYKKICFFAAGCLLGGHIVLNGYVFLSDVLPARMATTHLHSFFKKHRIHETFAYRSNLNNRNTIDVMKNPKMDFPLKFYLVGDIATPPFGYILIPPISGKSIWSNCLIPDYNLDPYLTELYESGQIDRYAVAKFKTVATSRLWNQEEEVCTYRDLVLRQISDEDRAKGFMYLLSADKLQESWFNCSSTQEKSRLFCEGK